MSGVELDLVTGSTGFVGRHMVELLLSKGHKVRATDLAAERPTFFPAQVHYIPADLTDPSTLGDVCEGVDVLFHPASIFDFSTPHEIMEKVNVEGTENLCEAASRAGVKRIVHWSTMMIFGDTAKKDTPMTEDTPRIAESIYASSKIRQEDVVLRYCRQGRLPATVIRPAIIYGPRSVYGLADMFIKLKLLPLIPLAPFVKNRLCMIHVADVVGSAYHLSQLDEAIGECYNVTDDFSHLPVGSLLTLAALIMEKNTVPIPLPAPIVRWFLRFLADFTEKHPWMKLAGRPAMEKDFVHLLNMDGYASNSKLKSTGYEFVYPDWRIGLMETASWYKEQSLW